MKIVDATEVASKLDTVAHWLWNQWGRPEGQTLAESRQNLERQRSPCSLVAVVDDEPRGVLVFRRVKYMGRPPLRLFIYSIYVDEGSRGEGIGTALLSEAVARASALDDAVHVYTDIPEWYVERGFSIEERDPKTGNVVLSRTLP